MAMSIARHTGVLELQHEALRVCLKYFRNWYHYHPRVFRLHFELIGDSRPEELEAGLKPLLRQLREVTVAARPLLFRTTVPEDSPLLSGLRREGFLETRRVYEPWLHPADVQEMPVVPPAGTVLIPLSSALDRNLQNELVELYVEIYARTSRLDPATPEQLSPDGWAQEFLEDPDLDRELSCCLLRGDRPVGLVTVYRGEQEDVFELGPFGVAQPELGMHQELTVAMLSRVMRKLRAEKPAGTKLVAEVDSDDPWTLYTCAEFPFRTGATSVSLALVPAWVA